MISKACPGLFDDPRHLQGQFLHLTGENIADKVERNLVGHLGGFFYLTVDAILNIFIFLSENMEEYLVSMNTSFEFCGQLDKIKEDCDIMFLGAKTHKYIHLLVNPLRLLNHQIKILFSVWQRTILMVMVHLF